MSLFNKDIKNTENGVPAGDADVNFEELFGKAAAPSETEEVLQPTVTWIPVGRSEEAGESSTDSPDTDIDDTCTDGTVVSSGPEDSGTASSDQDGNDDPGTDDELEEDTAPEENGEGEASPDDIFNEENGTG